jgi:4-amino-4-deoxy-L-arabinose transferase-like glycosyltransferase
MVIKTNKWSVLMILVICAITFFVNNRTFTPDIMEARNIVTAREMVQDGHWMVPTMNGELRLEKPPLPTWITAVTEFISPDNLALQRGMAGIAGTLLVIFFFLTVKTVTRDERNALISTIILCTCYNIVLMGRTATWDIYCHAFMMGAIYFMVCAFSHEGKAWGQFVMAGLMMGLSFMSKGPVSFYALLLPFLIAYIMCCHPSARGKILPIIVMIAVCVIVSGWWYAYIYAFQNDAMSYVAGKESGSWINHNVRPWWYYWKFFLEAGVWALLLLTAIFMPLHRRNNDYLMWVIWILAAVILLSLFPEKKPRYLLPIMMPAAAAIGWLVNSWVTLFEEREGDGVDKTLFRINSAIIAIIILASPVALWQFCYVPGIISLPVFLFFTVALVTIAATIGTGTITLRPMLLIYGVLALFLMAECFMMPALKKVINNPEMKSIALTRDIKQLNGVPFYYNSKHEMRIEIVYAAGRKIRSLDVAKADEIKKYLPCAILTHGSVGSELPATLWSSVDSIPIGQYDDNSRPKSYKLRYDSIFIYNVTLLKKK